MDLMFLETVEARGLAHLSYVIGDENAGACAVIDPRRDVQAYMEIAKRYDCNITHILETHIHADFVSGSRELHAFTHAPIYVGAAEGYGFAHHALHDGDTLELGSLELRAMHTPGHTPEHISYVVRGGKGASEPWGLFSGDTLFAGEVGRPDLLGESSQEPLARQLYHSLYVKILALPDGVIVYPAHGAGSPCGANIGDRMTTTIGYERDHNPRLQAKSEEEFVKGILKNLPPWPRYYPRMKKMNAVGPEILGPLPALPLLDADAVREMRDNRHALVVDLRSIEAFGGAHVPGSQNIAMREIEFGIWAGWLLSPDQPVLFVGDADDVERARIQMLRVGLENMPGALRSGIRGWTETGHEVETLPQMSVHSLHAHLEEESDAWQVVDVRQASEYEAGHIPGAVNLFAPFLPGEPGVLDPDRPTVTYCGSGYRASIAASMLQRHGFREVYSIPGSLMAWTAAGYPVEN